MVVALKAELQRAVGFVSRGRLDSKTSSLAQSIALGKDWDYSDDDEFMV